MRRGGGPDRKRRHGGTATIKDGLMSDHRDHTIATATVTSEEKHGVDDDQRAKLAEIADKTPVTLAVQAGTEIRITTEAA
jgi:hypothetical protein